MNKEVLIFGFYSKSSLGDDFFCEVFRELFPNYSLTFTDKIDVELASKFDIFFIGGGSFLNQKAAVSDEAIKIIKSKCLFFVGVGAETDINDQYQELLKSAQHVFIRSNDVNKISNQNVSVIPDLVYSLKDKVVFGERIPKSILILPNIYVIPNHEEPIWKLSSWEYFKNEFAQLLDELVDDGYKINFLSFSRHPKMNDDGATIEITNRMKKRNDYILNLNSTNFASISNIFSKYEKVITQRFHGIILSELTNTPYISIAHHQKFNSAQENSLSYFGLTKALLKEKLDNIQIPNKIISSHFIRDVKLKIENKINAFCGNKK